MPAECVATPLDERRVDERQIVREELGESSARTLVLQLVQLRLRGAQPARARTQ